MSKVCMNLDEVMGGISEKSLATLQHAAEISQFVTERTLGPDKACWRDAEATKKKQQRQRQMNSMKNENMPRAKGKLTNLELSKDDEEDSETEQKRNDNSPTKGWIEQTSINTTTLILEPPILQHLDYQTISTSVLLREAEQKRRRATRQHLIDMQDQRLASMRSNAELESTRRAVRDTWLEEHKRTDALIIAQAEQQAAVELQEHERQMQALQKQFQRQLHVITFQGVSTYQTKFCVKYENIAKLLTSIDNDALLSCTEYNCQLKEFVQLFEQLVMKIKAGECGHPELKSAENLCQSLDALEESIIIELENIVKREQQQAEAYKEAAAAAEVEQKRQQELQLVEQQQKLKQDAVDAAAAAAAAVVAEAAATVASLPPTSPPQLQPAASETTSVQSPAAGTATAIGNEPVSPQQDILEFYWKINAFYQEKVEKVKPLQSDENMKKWRFACQKAINIPVNAISAVSREHLQDKFEKLYNFISGQPIKTGGTGPEAQISVNDHPLGRDYCLLLMAKKFVSQGDTAISSNAQAAFPVASVIVSLWKLMPDFGRIFLAYTYKESPFLVPYLVPQHPGQSLEDYVKVLGYRVTADGQIENQDMYLKRQAGIARLYAAVMNTAGTQRLEASHPQHPYGLQHGWRWMALYMSFEPLPDISATLLLEMLQIHGADMWAFFGKQFVKLLFHMQLQYLPRLAAVDKGGPKARLELMLRKCLSEGQIPRALGVLPVGFW